MPTLSPLYRLARKQYSLVRKMFVVVTVIAIFLGWQLKFIRERQDVLAARNSNIEADGFPTCLFTRLRLHPTPRSGQFLFGGDGGDTPLETIWLWNNSTDADRQRTTELLPGARIGRRAKQVIHFPGGTKTSLAPCTH